MQADSKVKTIPPSGASLLYSIIATRAALQAACPIPLPIRSSKQQDKMSNYGMRVTMTDGGQLTGTLLAFDKVPINKPASTAGQITEDKRTLGLIILRGLRIVSLSVESPPPADPSSRLGTTTAGGPSAAGVAAAGPRINSPATRGLLIIGMGTPHLREGCHHRWVGLPHFPSVPLPCQAGFRDPSPCFEGGIPGAPPRF
ncbi:small nuclear ribonucleoprotein [Tuber indicum]|nr:small nuclear ribonucleoprotein [Tuber indicum]